MCHAYANIIGMKEVFDILRKHSLFVAVNLVLVLSLGGWLIKVFLPVKTNIGEFASKEYVLEGKKYNLLVADTPKKWQKGLMNFKELNGYDGMLFIFDDRDYRAFWNMNTYLDLTLIWIDGGKSIGTTELPSIIKTKNVKTVYSPSFADTVIELVHK